MSTLPAPSGRKILTGARADSRGSAASRAPVGDVEARRRSLPTSKRRGRHAQPAPHRGFPLGWVEVEPARAPFTEPGRSWCCAAIFVLGSAGKGARAVSPGLVVERIGEVDQAAHDSRCADQPGRAGTPPSTAAQERTQADEVEEAQLAQVDDARRRLLSRARELGLEQLDRVHVQLTNQPEPDPAGIGFAADYHKWRSLLVCSHPDSVRVIAHWAQTPTGVRAAGRSVGELGST